MIMKIIEILKKYKISIFIAIGVVLFGILCMVCFNMFFNKNRLIEYSNNYYILKYDKKWSLKEKENDKILLKSSNNAKIEISIIELSDENKYSSVENLIDEIIYNIENQNKDYKLLSKEETNLTKYEYSGYKLLFENGSSQVMSSIYKKSDKLIMINYESKNEYFDILLDSVHNIIYNFDTKEETYDLSYKIKIDGNDIVFSEDEELDNVLKENKVYEVANNNYYVKYSMPSVFELSDLNVQSNMFHLRGFDNKNIFISTYIYKSNIFEILDKENTSGVYSKYKSYKEDDYYYNFRENLSKIDDEIETYIYKCSYNYDKDFNEQEYKRQDENIILLYALNKNHTLQITIESKGSPITKKLLDNIELLEVKNYSSYTTSKEEDGLLVGTLKRYADYSKEKIDEITLKVPNKYKEIQRYNDVNSEKKYGINYDEENDIYDYTIDYKLTSIYAKVEDQVDSINLSFSKEYGEYNYLTKNDELYVNNKKIEVYSGGYTQLGGIIFTNINRFNYYINKKVLFYELQNGGYLVIEISGNGKNITEDIINDVTNFEIKEIDNK